MNEILVKEISNGWLVVRKMTRDEVYAENAEKVSEVVKWMIDNQDKRW